MGTIAILAAPLKAAQLSGESPDHAVAESAPGLCRPADGLSSHSLVSGGVERQYRMYLPRASKPHLPMPVVLDLHGSGSYPEQELAIDGMAAAADRYGFTVVLPVAARPYAGGGSTWNVPADDDYPDDVRYLADLIDELAGQPCFDGGRIFITGFSGGARLASRAACLLSGRIEAMAAVGGLRMPGSCAQALPVLAFHGTADPINPYPGGGPDYWQYGIDLAFAKWGESNQCADRPSLKRLAPDVEKLSRENCADGSEVTLYRIIGGGHVWPGSAFDFPEARFGQASANVDATRLILEFFERHRLGGP